MDDFMKVDEDVYAEAQRNIVRDHAEAVGPVDDGARAQDLPSDAGEGGFWDLVDTEYVRLMALDGLAPDGKALDVKAEQA